MIAVLMATPSVTFTFGPLIVPKRVFLTPIPHSSAISKLDNMTQERKNWGQGWRSRGQGERRKGESPGDSGAIPCSF